MARRFLTAAAAGRRRYVAASTPWHSRGSKRHLFLTASISRHQAAGAGFGHRRGHGTAPSALPGDHSKDLLMYSLHRKTIAASLAAAAIAGGLTLAGSVATAPAAEAALPIVGAGDILLPTDGSFTSGSGVDKLDPVTRVRSRAATLGGSVTQLVAAAPNGDFFMADRDIRIVKVDDVTGNQTTIKAPEFNTSNLVDLVVAADGNLIGLLLEASGNRLVRINAVTGAVTTLSSNGLLDPAGQSEFNEVAIEHDGRVLVSYGTRLLRVDPTTGAQTTVATFPSIVRGLAVRSDSQIFVRVDNISITPERLVKVNPQTGAQTNVSSGGVLTSLANQGLAFENGTHIVSAEGGFFGAGSVVRINTFTGNQDRLIQLGEGENNNIAVAGVNQIPPTPLPKAGNDIFSMDGSTGELQAGVLGNDSDPLGQKLTAEQVSQPSHGFTSFNADGSFFYFPDTGFVGTDTF